MEQSRRAFFATLAASAFLPRIPTRSKLEGVSYFNTYSNGVSPNATLTLESIQECMRILEAPREHLFKPTKAVIPVPNTRAYRATLAKLAAEGGY